MTKKRKDLDTEFGYGSVEAMVLDAEKGGTKKEKKKKKSHHNRKIKEEIPKPEREKKRSEQLEHEHYEEKGSLSILKDDDAIAEGSFNEVYKEDDEERSLLLAPTTCEGSHRSRNEKEEEVFEDTEFGYGSMESMGVDAEKGGKKKGKQKSHHKAKIKDEIPKSEKKKKRSEEHEHEHHQEKGSLSPLKDDDAIAEGSSKAYKEDDEERSLLPALKTCEGSHRCRNEKVEVFVDTEFGYGSMETTGLDAEKGGQKKEKQKSHHNAKIKEEFPKSERKKKRREKHEHEHEHEHHEEKGLLSPLKDDDASADGSNKAYKEDDIERPLLLAPTTCEGSHRCRNEKEDEVFVDTIERQPSKKLKKVTFSEQNEVLEETVSKVNSDNDGMNGLETTQEKNKEQFVWGKRFTKEEDEIIKLAVFDYIKVRGWDEKQGLTMILNCQKYKEASKCWAEIRKCLPHRPKKTIRFRAHVLLEEGTHLGYWSKDEQDQLIRLQQEYGRQWRKISSLIGRGRINVKEKWRTLKREPARGYWTQDELKKLSDLVHKSLRIKKQQNFPKNENDHRILRDNINWEVIADEIRTHNHGSCCTEWYKTLASSMVVSGEWENADDCLLLQRLLEVGASSEEEVEWDQLLEHRTADVCMKRWRQMVKHLGENRRQPFVDKLDMLVQRYAPDILKEDK